MVRDYLRGLVMYGMAEQVLAEELAELTGQPWEVECTGGGCMALVWYLKGHALLNSAPDYGHYFMVTDEGASVPLAAEPCCLGEYVDGFPLNYWYFPNRKKLIKFLQVWNTTREGGSL